MRIGLRSFGLVGVLCASGAHAQAAGPSAAGPSQEYDLAAFTPLRWRSVGPFRAGRSVAVAGSVARPNEYYTGTTGGGVFKTTSGGNTWFPVTDGYFGGTIGAIAISASHPDIVYVGTGEYAIRNNVSPGDGVYKTTDGGKTWAFLGLKETRHIAAVQVHPTNPELVYVAALGHAFGPNPERGVYRSTNGGRQWQRLLFLNDSVGAVDLAMDPSNPRTLYAAFAYLRESPGLGSITGKASGGIFKSTDGGDRWIELTRNPGLPKGRLGNVGLAVSPADPKLIWAIVEAKAEEGGLFRSRDAGVTWALVNNGEGPGGSDVGSRPAYFSRVTADPKDPDTVYLPSGDFIRSTDGGKVFRSVQPSGPHKDPQSYDFLYDAHHLWIAPDNPKRMILATDMGTRVSPDAGTTWSPVSQATGQFYTLTTTNHFPYQLCGSQQDNDANCGPSRSDRLFDISTWYKPGVGERLWVVARPDRPEVTFGGGLYRHDRATGFTHDLLPWMPADLDRPEGRGPYRWHSLTPLHFSPHDPNVLYVGANVLFRTRDDAQTWEVISPDLTRHTPPPFESGRSGALITIAESPVTPGVIWTGSEDGVVSVTRNGGRTWANVTPSDLPELGQIHRVDASPHAPGTAYFAATRHLLDDYTPYLYRTTDYGRTWTRIDTELPRDEFARVVREDPVRSGLLFAGTERGVWVSFDGGGRWQSLRRNLPIVPIHDLVIKEGDIAVATHGRSYWILDDISPLRQLTPAIMAQPAHLLQPRDAVRVRWAGRFGERQFVIHGTPIGENPPGGVLIHYWLKAGGEPVTLELLDAAGKMIRSFTGGRSGASSGAGSADLQVLSDAGVNQFAWDYQYPPGPSTTDTLFESIAAVGFSAPPARYAVRLRVGSVTQTRTFLLKKDPRSPAAVEDLRFNATVNSHVRRGIDAVNALHALREKLAERAERLPADHATRRRIDALRDSTLAIQRRFVNPAGRSDPRSALAALRDLSQSGSQAIEENARPTAHDRMVLTRATATLRAGLARLADVVGGGLPNINAGLRAAALEEVAVPAAFGQGSPTRP